MSHAGAVQGSALALLVLVSACSRKAADAVSAAPSGAAAGTAIPIASTRIAEAAPSSSSAADLPPVPCWTASGYRGEVVGQAVFARLALSGKQLRGRYFYERVGVDLGLAGKLGEAGGFSLSEGPSGRFEGRCEEPTGVLSGTWSKGAKGPAAGSFRLVPIVPGDVPVVAAKRSKYASQGVASPDDDAATSECSFTEARVELFGLKDPRVERQMNGQGLEPRTGPVLAKAEDMCNESGGEGEVEQRVLGSFRELVTLQTSGWNMVPGAAHPNYGWFERATWDLRTGRAIGPKEVLARDITGQLVACAEKTQSAESQPMGGWEELAAHFDLTPAGVHFFAVDFPHYNAGLTGTGPTVSYAVLLRDGLLRKDSPVKRAWEGVTQAGKEEDFCSSWD
jgi:hypothetical protein